MNYREVVKAFAEKHVVVVGDVMLDAYLTGEVLRISPEAPVPVVEVHGNSSRAGGAANTALNIIALGGRASLIGVVGADEEGGQLQKLLGTAGLDPSTLVQDSSRPTTCKTRIVARGQQIVRLDRESRQPVPRSVEDQLIQIVEEKLADADACILSDYDKGILTPRLCARAIAHAQTLGCPVVVDPKGKDFSRYRGCAVVTPNTRELEIAVGHSAETDEALVRAGFSLLRDLAGSAVLVTRGAAGMTLFRPQVEPRHLSTSAQLVYDVTGAGDTVAGTLALGLAVRIPVEVSMDLANCAAGVTVGKMGASTVSPEELLDALHFDPKTGPSHRT
jgi:D-beta-D-heptose 7-phosphate kinase/D-beta-D-heptose 1-phosphate adenosyltransferase